MLQKSGTDEKAVNEVGGGNQFGTLPHGRRISSEVASMRLVPRRADMTEYPWWEPYKFAVLETDRKKVGSDRFPEGVDKSASHQLSHTEIAGDNGCP
jgi:hypothetical protein